MSDISNWMQYSDIFISIVFALLVILVLRREMRGSDVKRIRAPIFWASWLQLSGLYIVDVVIVVAAVAIFLWTAMSALSGSTFGGDIPSFWTFLNFVLRDSILRFGEVPLWNPYYFSGMPYVANPQTSPFYLSTLLILPFGEVDGIRYSVILHVVLSGLNMYYLMLTLKQRRRAALISALGYMFSGYLIARIAIGHIPFVYGYAWAPLALAFCEKAITSGSLWYALLVGATLTLQIQSGALILLAYTAIFLVLYLTYCCARAIHQGSRQYGRPYSRLMVTVLPIVKFAMFALTIGLSTFLLSAVKIFPMLEFALETARLGERGGVLGGIPSIQAIYNVLLERNVQVYHDTYGFGWWEFCSYLGGIAFLGAAAPFLRPKNKHTIFFTVLALFGILLAMGTYSPFRVLVMYLYDNIPFFSTLLHLPARFVFLTVLSMSVLSGITASAVADAIDKLKGRKFRLTWLLLLIILTLIMVDLRYFVQPHLGTVNIPWKQPFTSMNPNDLSVSWLEYPVDIATGQGEPFKVVARVKNIGDTVWLKDSGQPGRSGDPWYQKKGIVNLGISIGQWDYRFPLPRNLAPGEDVELTATLLAPQEPGKYRLKMNLVDELVTWFSPPYPSGNLTVTLPTETKSNTVVDHRPINSYGQQHVLTWLSEQGRSSYFRVGPYSASEGRLHEMAMMGLFHVGGYETGGILLPHYNNFVSNLSLRDLGLLNVRYLVSDKEIRDVSLRFVDKFETWSVYENRQCLPRAFTTSHAILVVGKDVEASKFEHSLINAQFFDPGRIALVRGDSLYAKDYSLNLLRKFNFVTILPYGAEIEEDSLAEKCLVAGVPLIRYSEERRSLLENAIASTNASVGNAGEVTRYTPNRIIIKVKNAAPSFLVLSEAYSQGWKAYVDGKETPIMLVFSTLRGIPLDEVGEHEVSVFYQPMSYVAGLATTLVTFALIVAVAIRSKRVKDRRMRLAKEAVKRLEGLR